MDGLARKLAIALSFALIAAACGDDDDGTAGAEGGDGSPITVGAIFDLSGPTSDVGQPYADGIKDYVDFVNSNGGIEGRRIDLTSSDFGYEVPRAEQFYSQFVSEGAVAFMGWGTADTEALRDKVTNDQIPFMSASYSEVLVANPDETPYNFFPGVTYSQQMRAVLKHISEQEDERVKVAVFHHDSPFGQSPLADGEKYIADNGLDIEFTPVTMPTGATDFVGQLQNEGAGADYIVIQNTSAPAAVLIQNVASAGLDTQVVCMNWCADELMVAQAGDAAEGVLAVMFFTPPDATAGGLEEIATYLEGKGQSLEGKSLRYVQGWFTMKSMAEGIRQAIVSNPDGEITGADIKEGLETMDPVETGGVTPEPIDYGPDQHEGLTTTPLYRVEGGTFVQHTDPITP